MILGQVGGSSFDPIRSNTCGIVLPRLECSNKCWSFGRLHQPGAPGKQGIVEGRDRTDRDYRIFLPVIYRITHSPENDCETLA